MFESPAKSSQPRAGIIALSLICVSWTGIILIALLRPVLPPWVENLTVVCFACAIVALVFAVAAFVGKNVRITFRSHWHALLTILLVILLVSSAVAPLS